MLLFVIKVHRKGIKSLTKLKAYKCKLLVAYNFLELMSFVFETEGRVLS